MGFIKINNRSNFITTTIEVHHPETRAYLDYWRMHKKRCIEGFWSIDDDKVDIDINKPIDESVKSNKWRYMPEKLYFYVNFGTILHKPEDSPKTTPKQKMRPLLRDVEWEFFYNITEARGFSGFEDDDEYTCNHSVLLQEEQLHSSCINPHTKKPKTYLTPREYLRMLHDKPKGRALWENQAKNLFVLGCLGKDSEVRAFDGKTIKAQDVKVGDLLLGPDSSPREVKELIRGENLMYKITSRYGDEFTCSGFHMLHLGKKKQLSDRTIYEPVNIMLQEFIEYPDEIKKNYQLLRSPAVEYPKKELKWHPYFLGLWLGDGFKHYRKICVNQDDDKEILNWLIDYANSDKERFRYSLTKSKNGLSDGYTTRFHLIDKPDCNKNSWFAKTLKLNKHIPEEYLLSSVEQRLELLAGMIDSDGSLDRTRYRITNMDFDLIRQFQDVARSLGFKATIMQNKKCHGLSKNLAYTLTITGDLSIIPCKVKRKQSTYNKHAKGCNINNIYIEPIGFDNFYGFEVDKDHLYLLKDYTIDHNSRGFGKSFSLGVGLVLHELLFDGARYYTQESISNPFKVEVLVGAAMASKSSDLLSKTLDAYNNLPGAYGTDAEYVPSPFYKQLTGSLGSNNTKNPWRHEYEKKIGGQWVKQGTGSNLKHAIFTIENPEAAAGTRPGIIVVEETGLVPNLLTIHGSNSATQMEGSIKFGSSFYIGTGGNMEKITESQIIFYDPDGFDFLAFDNEYEEDNRKIGFFVPAYYALNQYKDSNGNTNEDAAKSYLLKVREKKKRSKDTSALDLEMMNYPIVPSEMFLSKTGNIFPTAMLKDRQIEIESNTKYENALYIGRLKYSPEQNNVEWVLDPEARPLKKFPLTKEDESRKEGALVIYNHPYQDEYGDVLYGRYLLGLDPYDHDESGTGSLGSLLVYDRFTNEIVAEYTGRPQTAKEFYEICRLTAKYYNGKILYENERKGIFDYFESKNSLHLLQEQPEIIKDVLQNTKVNRQYGMHMNSALKRYGEELIKTWLLSPNDETNPDTLNAHKLRCLPLIQELIAYNPQGNYDRVMALMMLMYFIQETRKIEIHSTQVRKNEHIAHSSFFNKGLFNKKSKSLL